MSDPVLPITGYFLKELAQLEDDCANFALTYPRIAGNLGLGSEGATDPHVRQLIESVAFVAARLKRQIDAAPGELAYGALRSLAPQLSDPVPCMSVARFTPRSQHLAPLGLQPPRTLRLQAGAPGGECTFTAAAADIALWPLSCEAFSAVDGVGRRSRALLDAIDLNSFAIQVEHSDKDLTIGAPGELTFFVSGAIHRALAGVEALVSGVESLRMVALDGTWSRTLSPRDVNVLGFEEAHRMVAPSHAALQASALAGEFLNFPRRFCFVKIGGLNCPQPSRGFVLVFQMRPDCMAALQAIQHQIQLNCVPVVNLYKRPPVALVLKGARDEYRIPRADSRRGQWDVFAVHSVKLMARDRELTIGEYHSASGGSGSHAAGLFWQAVRKDRVHNDLGHASLAMRFLNLDSATAEHFDLAMLEVSCTNCEAPEQLLAGQSMQPLGWDSPYVASLELTPTPYVPPVLHSDESVIGLLSALQWRSGGNGGLTHRMREYLRASQRGSSAHAGAVIESLKDIRRRVVAMPWPGMPVAGALGMGCEYVITLGDTVPGTGTRYLLTRILRRILTQVHDLPMPLDVHFLSPAGELIRVE